MSSSIEPTDRSDGEASGRTGMVLVAAAVALLVGAGLLLWWRHGDAVFGDMVLAGLAWCF